MSLDLAKKVTLSNDPTLSGVSTVNGSTEYAIYTFVTNEIASIPTPTTPDLDAVLTQGNTTGGNDLVVSTGDVITVDDVTASTIAVYDGSKGLSYADTATYPSLTELSYVKGVTSSVQDQIDNVSRVLDSQFNIASTATTSEEILYSYEITAGTWAVNEWIEMTTYVRKTSGTGAWTGRVYLNNANSLTGATQYGTAWNYTSANVNATWASRIWLQAAAQQYGQPTTGGVLWSATGIGGTMGSSTYSSASSIWVIVSSQKATAGDAAGIVIASLLINKL